MKLDANYFKAGADTLTKHSDIDVYIAPDIPKDKLEKYLDFFNDLDDDNYAIDYDDVMILIDYPVFRKESEFAGLIATKDKIMFESWEGTYWRIDIENIEYVIDSYCDVILKTYDDDFWNITFPTLGLDDIRSLKRFLIEFIELVSDEQVKVNNIDGDIKSKGDLRFIVDTIASQYVWCESIEKIIMMYYGIESDAVKNLDEHEDSDWFASTIVRFLDPDWETRVGLMYWDHIHSRGIIDDNMYFVREKFFTLYRYCLTFVSEAISLPKEYINGYIVGVDTIRSRIKEHLDFKFTHYAEIPTYTNVDEARNRLLNQDIRELRVIETPKKIEEPKSSGSSGMISNFIDNNASGILSALKQNGLSLTTAALENEENIGRIAGVIHGILPGQVRFFVNYQTVEKFLLENRYWLIDKLR